MDITLTFGERLRKARKSKGITQAELAEAIGVHEMTIRRWETDKRSPRIEEIRALASFLEIPVDFLMGESEKPSLLKTLNNMVNPFPAEPQKVNDNIKEQKGSFNMAYWGGVADNVQNLADSGDKDKIISVAFMLKNALSSLLNKAGVNEAGIKKFYMENNTIFNSVVG